jgi:transcriptional regulator with GAF, ATPase, and Fis domain
VTRITAALAATGGNVVRAAQQLGTHPRQLYRWIERHAIPLDDYRQKPDK